jgi:RimJ/RimL family protein N-acetyltransferase
MRGTYCDLISLNVAAHAPELFAAYSAATDDGDWTYLPYGPFTSLGDFTAWAAAMVGLADPVFFTVIDKSDARACGVASYLRITPASASIEVGHIHFSRRLQQTPAATETMYLMMRHAFKLGNRRYEWKCDSLNEPSRKAAQRLGFTFEGTFRQATGYKGRNRDTAWFSIIDTEWPSISAEFQRWLAPSNFDETGNQLTTLGVR